MAACDFCHSKSDRPNYADNTADANNCGKPAIFKRVSAYANWPPGQSGLLIGTNTLVDKSGVLLGVGANFILINEAETDDVVACDFYNIKFIKFYY